MRENPAGPTVLWHLRAQAESRSMLLANTATPRHPPPPAVDPTDPVQVDAAAEAMRLHTLLPHPDSVDPDAVIYAILLLVANNGYQAQVSLRDGHPEGPWQRLLLDLLDEIKPLVLELGSGLATAFDCNPGLRRCLTSIGWKDDTERDYLQCSDARDAMQRALEVADEPATQAWRWTSLSSEPDIQSQAYLLVTLIKSLP